MDSENPAYNTIQLTLGTGVELLDFSLLGLIHSGFPLCYNLSVRTLLHPQRQLPHRLAVRNVIAPA